MKWMVGLDQFDWIVLTKPQFCKRKLLNFQSIFPIYIYLDLEFRKQQQTNEIGAENECKNYSWHFCAFSVISSDTSHREVGLIRRPNLWYLGARWFWLSPLPKAPGRCCLLHSVANYIKLIQFKSAWWIFINCIWMFS